MTGTDIWVDPICPYAWLTARWPLEVEEVREVQVLFHVMSLSVLEEGRDDLSEQYRQLLDLGWGPVGVLIAAEQAYGPAALRALYTALGTRIHLQDRGPVRTLYHEALTAAGLPANLADAAATSEFDEALHASHHASMDPVGEDVGTPVIHTPGPDGKKVAFFGPVVMSGPEGDAAGTDGFYELMRTWTREPVFDLCPSVTRRHYRRRVAGSGRPAGNAGREVGSAAAVRGRRHYAWRRSPATPAHTTARGVRCWIVSMRWPPARGFPLRS
jgi:hypothetical protein